MVKKHKSDNSNKVVSIFMSIIFIAIILWFFAMAFNNSKQSIEIKCNSPYMVKGTECCLDKDFNFICDEDEVIKQVDEVKNLLILTVKEIKIGDDTTINEPWGASFVPYEEGKTYILDGFIIPGNIAGVQFKVENTGKEDLRDLLVTYECFDTSTGRSVGVCDKPVVEKSILLGESLVNICSHGFSSSNLVSDDLKTLKYIYGESSYELWFALRTDLLKELWTESNPEKYHKINCEVKVDNGLVSATSKFSNYLIRDDKK